MSTSQLSSVAFSPSTLLSQSFPLQQMGIPRFSVSQSETFGVFPDSSPASQNPWLICLHRTSKNLLLHHLCCYAATFTWTIAMALYWSPYTTRVVRLKCTPELSLLQNLPRYSPFSHGCYIILFHSTSLTRPSNHHSFAATIC